MFFRYFFLLICRRNNWKIAHGAPKTDKIRCVNWLVDTHQFSMGEKITAIFPSFLMSLCALQRKWTDMNFFYFFFENFVFFLSVRYVHTAALFKPSLISSLFFVGFRRDSPHAFSQIIIIYRRTTHTRTHIQLKIFHSMYSENIFFVLLFFVSSLKHIHTCIYNVSIHWLRRL